MPGWPIRKNDSGGATLVFPIYDNDGDLVPGAAALDSERSIDQGTFTDCTNEAVEIATSSGMYSLVLTQAEINGDEIATITKTTTTDAKTAPNVIYTSTRNIDDLAFPATSGRSLLVAAGGEVAPDFANINGTLDAADIGADAITAAKIAANAIGASELATDAIGAAQIATAAIDADALADDAITEIRSLVNGTSDSGTTLTMVDAARTEADTDYFKGAFILFTSGNITGQVRLITAFTPASDTITFAPATTQAVATQNYEILPAARVDLQLWLGSVVNALVAGAVDADVSAIQNDVITAAAIANAAIDAATFAAGAINAAAIANSAIDAATFAAGAIDAAAIATDAFDADALAADAAIEIADAILVRDMDQVEGSAPIHSLTSAILKAVSRIVDNAGTLETYETDETTLHMSQTITTNPSGDPIDELSGTV